jgi:methyltransferase-like protein
MVPSAGPEGRGERAFVAVTRDVRPDDVIAREQYADFLRGRKFRQSLLCHADAKVMRPPDASRVRSLYALAPVRPESAEPDVRSNRPERFLYEKRPPIGTTQSVPKAALVELSRRWPVPVAFDELLDATRHRLGGGAETGPGSVDVAPTLAMFLLHCYSNAVVDLRAHAPRMVAGAGERPTSSPLARVQARSGPLVTDLLGRQVRLDAPLVLRVLQLCDRTRDRGALVRELGAPVFKGNAAMEKNGRRVTDPAEVRGLLRESVDSSLKELARLALLVA